MIAGGHKGSFWVIKMFQHEVMDHTLLQID